MKLCFGSDVQKQRDCAVMAAELILAPLKLCFPHPQQYAQYGLYQLREFIPVRRRYF
jgi:hypothetical protein